MAAQALGFANDLKAEMRCPVAAGEAGEERAAWPAMQAVNDLQAQHPLASASGTNIVMART